MRGTLLWVPAATLLVAACVARPGTGGSRVSEPPPGPSCGDGVQDPGEACDDGNDDDTDSCTSLCQKAACGDGFVQTGEQCDQGAHNSDTSGACRTNCQLPICGDGITDPGEACDDGNSIPDDACSNTCSRPGCGDGVKDRDEDCDDGNKVNDDGCTNACTLPACGDGIVQTGEECDQGPRNGGSGAGGCRADCTKARCGDGTLDSGEECDDGAANSATESDACRLTCQKARCGDGVVDSKETCDDGNRVDGDDCTNACQVAVCGDGVVRAGVEQCDDGPRNSDSAPNACRASCRPASCGDGVRDRGESCDDGNQKDGDGCSARCYLELPVVGGDLEVVGSLGPYDPTWSRPDEDCVTENQDDYYYYYDELTFVNDGSETLNVRAVALFGDDGYLFVYGQSFDPTSPTRGCLNGNDNYQEDPSKSRVVATQVAPGSTLRLVVTTHYPKRSIGPWSLDVQTSLCGDGDTGPGETCDDGNTASGDGCGSSCQDESLRESEPNDKQGSANPIVVGGWVRASIDPAYDVDVFSFDGFYGATYEVRTWAGSLGDCAAVDGLGADTSVAVANDEYSYYWQNNDGFTFTPCAELVIIPSRDLTYYASVYSQSSVMVDPYFLEVTQVESESEGNDTIGSANPLAMRHTVHGAIRPADDVDTYSFKARAGVTYTIITYAGEIGRCDLGNGNSAQTNVTVRDADGNNAGSESGSGTSPCALLHFRPKANGTYYVQVTGPDTVDPYFLQIIGP